MGQEQEAEGQDSLTTPSWLICSFPAITNLVASNNTNLLFYSSGGWKPKITLTGIISKCHRAASLLCVYVCNSFFDFFFFEYSFFIMW